MLLPARPPLAGAAGLAHGASPLGALKYPDGFEAFDYVRPDAPKGGSLRLARIGAFDTLDTLRYPGRPPGDLRLIFDRLIVPSADEPAGYYGLLADGVALSSDLSRIELTLDPAARWHDGRPVTTDDVVFTFETLKREGAPFYRQAFRTLSVRAEGPRRLAFASERPGDRELIGQIAALPIHPAHAAREGTAAPLGSGPYRLAEADAPRRLVLTRVPDYWAADKAVNRGRHNFDRLVFDYFRDSDVALEAFLGGETDLHAEAEPIRFAALAGRDGLTVAEAPLPMAGALYGLVFNLRRPPFGDPRVRRALALAYAFEPLNRMLFGGGHKRFESVFGETDLAAGGPASAAERALFSAAGATVPAAVLASADPFGDAPPPGTRAALAEADRLLAEAGLTLRDGVRRWQGAPLSPEVVTADPAFDRVLGWLAEAWRRLGIELRTARGDPASVARRMLDRGFDLAPLSWTPAPLPGSAERLLWHSDLAAQPGSYALSGIEDPALDAAIEALTAARSATALRTAGRAFDRAFRHALPMLPLWRDATQRLAWHDGLGRPSREAAPGLPLSPLDRWWREDAGAPGRD